MMSRREISGTGWALAEPYPGPRATGGFVDRKVGLEITDSGECTLQLAGDWEVGERLPDVADVIRRIDDVTGVTRLSFDTGSLGAWDSALLTFLIRVIEHAGERRVKLDASGLPLGVRRLINLASTVPEVAEHAPRARVGQLARIGNAGIRVWVGVRTALDFVGDVWVACLSLLRGRARFRARDLGTQLMDAGPRALPIVSLISLLVGLILAFVGAIQLQLFGAQIFIANLVGLGMAREMGAMMTAVIMAGRTGAAFATQLGTMQVNEEIDALRTLGISPMEFLVLPRMLALVLMLPLLCLYADFLGILGGMLVGISLMDISFVEYINQTQGAVQLIDFGAGLFKSLVFGLLVALAGCMRGMQSGRSSEAVGKATTSAVVTSIVLIVVADAVLTVLFDILQI